MTLLKYVLLLSMSQWWPTFGAKSAPILGHGLKACWYLESIKILDENERKKDEKEQ